MKLYRVAAALPLVACVANADSTVTKVVNLLTELKGKVEADLQAEEALMAEYTQWCEDEQVKTEYAIKDEKRVISQLQATVESETAKIDQFAGEIEQLGPSIASKNSESSSAEAVRKNENSEFVVQEKELVEAEDMLRQAYSTLKRKMVSLLQSGSTVNLKNRENEELNVKNVVKALGVIVNAAWVTTDQANKLKAFIDSSNSLDDDLSLNMNLNQQAPQVKTYNYESKSGGILEVIDNMRDQVMENLRKVRNQETKSRHSYELLKQSLTNEIATLSDQLSQAQTNKGEAEEAKGRASVSLKETDEALKADEDYLATMKHDCSTKQQEWVTRQAEAQEEMKVIEEAKEVLMNKVTVLAQIDTKTRGEEDDGSKRTRVVQLLRKLGHKFNSFGLLQAATAANQDPFAKVRGLLQDLILKLEQQAREESTHNEMCVKELAKNEKKKEKKMAELEKYNTRFDAASAKTATLKAEIVTLQEELKDLDTAVSEATQFRKKEHEENTRVIADNKESAAAVAEAIKMLRDYYGSASPSFLQTRHSVSARSSQAPVFQSAKFDSTHGIIEILETAQSDFTKLFMETESEESEAQDNHKKFLQEAEVTKAKKAASIDGKSAEINTLAVSLSQVKEDIENTEKELTAVVTTLHALHKQCDNKAMSYAERKARREQEIAGLTEALDILATPEDSFLQKKPFLKRH